MFGLFRRWRRRRLLRQPFPPAWQAILERNAPLVLRLPAELQSRVRDSIRILLAEKRFDGAGGLVMTDEIRVTIAAHAALLLLGRAQDWFPRTGTILVYPGAYQGPVTRQTGGIVEESEQGRLGESWPDGTIVLAWDSVLRGARDVGDGRNVVLHEFAHQLDQEDGTSDGTPYLGGRGLYAAWARTLGADYQQLREADARGFHAGAHAGALDAYGATNPAEFFAVATEAFFEKPRLLRARNPALYGQLRDYYGFDP